MEYPPPRSTRDGIRIAVFTLFLTLLAGAGYAQTRCLISAGMANHNRYAYDTAEECSWPHTIPFGNWGVSSNVGFKLNGEQFKGWDRPCSQTNPQWNSCSVGYVKPDLDCTRLNFPDNLGSFPYPTNGYPFTDSYNHNDSVFAPLFQKCVDQYSPCGVSFYGGASIAVPVSPVVDYDYDGIMDSGGCLDLNGYQVLVQQNFMTVYELDHPDPDDVINSLFYPDVSVTLSCSPESCFAVNDLDFNRQVDDIADQSSPAYVHPYLYQNNNNLISYSTDPGVPAKRIDATIRIGSVFGLYSGPYPCNPADEEACSNMSLMWWDSSTCSCQPYILD